MLVYKVLSVLLDYPTQEHWDHWSELQGIIPELEHVTDEDRTALETFMCRAAKLSLTEFQENYVKTFDLTPNNTLYLTHHLFEEQDRERGPTLVNLSDYFKSQGYQIESGELPDYLPLMLEYVSTLEDMMSARLFLRESAHVSALVAGNLEQIQSPYAPLLRIVEQHGRLSEIAA